MAATFNVNGSFNHIGLSFNGGGDAWFPRPEVSDTWTKRTQASDSWTKRTQASDTWTKRT